MYWLLVYLFSFAIVYSVGAVAVIFVKTSFDLHKNQVALAGGYDVDFAKLGAVITLHYLISEPFEILGSYVFAYIAAYFGRKHD